MIVATREARCLSVNRRLALGTPAPLGATWDGDGVNFALYSENATGVELCLVDAIGQETRIPLRERTGFVWHGYVEGVRPGQLYGYRVTGRRSRSAGCASTTKRACSIRTRRRSTASRTGTPALFAYDLGSTGDLDAQRAATSAARRAAVVIDPRSTGETTRRRDDPVPQVGHLRGARQGR